MCNKYNFIFIHSLLIPRCCLYAAFDCEVLDCGAHAWVWIIPVPSQADVQGGPEKVNHYRIIFESYKSLPMRLFFFGQIKVSIKNFNVIKWC